MMDFNIRKGFESSQWRIVVPVPPTQIRQSFAQFLPTDKIGLGADANDGEITASRVATNTPVSPMPIMTAV